GKIDENLTQQCGTSDIGACKFGVQTCQRGNWGKCVGAVNPADEICDGMDNDCDGQIDKGDVGCSSCQYCKDGKCTARPDGYNDCDVGCQRCVNGSCEDYNAACPDCQYCKSDICHNNCQGTDTDCGCESCTNCNSLDDWFDLGSSFSCCDGNKACTCQNQEFRDYFCSEASCGYSITNTKIDKNNCTECGSSKYCSNGFCQTQSTPITEETYSYHDYYPIILSLSDNKGNIFKRSYYNNYEGLHNIWQKPTLSVGDEIHLKVEASDPRGRKISYWWSSNSYHFRE
ncbi:unnamed protein product, partial [marine sediment metagenome]